MFNPETIQNLETASAAYQELAGEVREISNDVFRLAERYQSAVERLYAPALKAETAARGALPDLAGMAGVKQLNTPIQNQFGKFVHALASSSPDQAEPFLSEALEQKAKTLAALTQPKTEACRLNADRISSLSTQPSMDSPPAR